LRRKPFCSDRLFQIQGKSNRPKEIKPRREREEEKRREEENGRR
jgi:hypothetical protein